MNSNNSDPAMNMYVFNEDKGNWELMGGNTIIDSNDSKLLSDMIDTNTINRILSSVSYQPPPIYYDLINFSVHKENKLKSFKINLSRLPTVYHSKDARKSFEELKILRKYDWIYDGEEVVSTMGHLDSISDFINDSYKKFRERQLSFSSNKTYKKDSPTFINNISITTNPDDDNYLLTLFMFNDTLVIPVYPKIDSKYPELVQRRNKQFYKGYNRAIKRNEKNWSRADKKYEKLLAQYESNFANQNRDIERNRKSLETQTMVNRALIY
ncbi:MAG: hypothetical protein JKX68_02130 [Flavobacteriales bacterium]|nr:hypothetical protein [Flavobacteriales bacterium]